MSDTERRSAEEILIAGLRDAHAMERQAAAVLDAQLPSLKDYGAFHDRVARHVDESRVQAERLEAALSQCGASPSALKDFALSAMGLGQSTAQRFAGDAPIKALLADTMFEHLEIAAYRALIEMADLAGRPGLRAGFEASLVEEKAMAEWLEANLANVTRAYVAASGGPSAGAASAPPRGPESAPGSAPGSASASASQPAPAPAAPPAPEAPLRDLAEFTDAEPDRADWPDGDERPSDRASRG